MSMINCKPKYTYFKNSDSITNKKKTKDDIRIFSLYTEISEDVEKLFACRDAALKYKAKKAKKEETEKGA